jgi:prevent-host-death family protein
MSEPTSVSLYQAKTHLSDLGDRAARGEEIIVTKHGRPRFMLAPLAVRKQRPGPGGSAMQGIRIGGDFDAPDEEIERLFGTRD